MLQIQSVDQCVKHTFVCPLPLTAGKAVDYNQHWKVPKISDPGKYLPQNQNDFEKKCYSQNKLANQ